MIDRRTFLAGTGAVLLAAPLAAEAQQAGRVYRIGMLETTSPALNAANLDAFRQGLRELGYVEGHNFMIEYRSVDGRPERFPDLAAELVRLKVDLIVTRGTPAVLAAKNARRTIPIVMATSADPVAAGVVSGLARPGGNVTGLTSIDSELIGKRFALLKEAIPSIARIALVLNLSNPSLVTQRKQIEVAARSLRFQPQFLDVRKPEDLGPAFDTAIKQRADAVHVSLDSLTQTNLGRIVDLAAKHRLPTIYSSRDFVDAGGLMAYGVSRLEMYRRAATIVDKIFKGAKLGDLPVEQPTKFEFVINLKTAKALGLTIPPSLLGRADEIIQ
jgi:putative tryptophan/tyrosine transport system substrate-binding protein